MSDTVAPEFVRFVADQRRAERQPEPPAALAAGDSAHPVFVEAKQASALLRVAARRAAGLYHASRRTEVVWVQGENELAVSLVEIAVEVADGLLAVRIPVRCDQTGTATVTVHFAVGSPKEPAGLYAAALRRPGGPALVVGIWGEALTAFAWQCVLGLVSGIAGATGKDARGNVLVPAELAVSDGGLQIVPMARHRFAGSTGLGATTTKAP